MFNEFDITCDCHSHKVTFCYDPEDDTFYNLLWFMGGSDDMTLINRIKLAWNILIKGNVLIYDIVFDGDKMRSFIKWLDNCTEIRQRINKREQ